MKKQMTNQEVFDKVARALMKQGEASVPANYGSVDNDMCRYRIRRGTRTLKCAVGHLIPARLYDREMEGADARSVIFGGRRCGHRFEDISEECGLSNVNPNLLAYLQSAHDNLLADEGSDAWRAQMLRIAGEFGLNADVLNEK